MFHRKVKRPCQYLDYIHKSHFDLFYLIIYNIIVQGKNLTQSSYTFIYNEN